jgi:nitroreductase
MDAITALCTRISVAKLTDPAPTEEQMAILIQAANRAADHGRLTPWRFMAVEGDARERLGQVFLDAAKLSKPDLSEAEADRFLSMPLRAPYVLVCIACLQDHPKVPHHEQRMAAAAATQHIITAAFALGVGAIWRTGDLAYDDTVKAALGLRDKEEIIGFVYLGTPITEMAPPKPADVRNFLTVWQP